MTKRTPTAHRAPQEVSAWLRAAGARRVAQVRALGLDPDAEEPVIFMTLTDADPGDRDQWEMSCDRCGAHRPDDLRLAHYRAARGLVLGVGLCPGCTRREGLR